MSFSWENCLKQHHFNTLWDWVLCHVFWPPMYERRRHGHYALGTEVHQQDAELNASITSRWEVTGKAFWEMSSLSKTLKGRQTPTGSNIPARANSERRFSRQRTPGGLQMKTSLSGSMGNGDTKGGGRDPESHYMSHGPHESQPRWATRPSSVKWGWWLYLPHFSGCEVMTIMSTVCWVGPLCCSDHSRSSQNTGRLALSPLYRQGSWSSKRLSCLPKVTELVEGRAEPKQTSPHYQCAMVGGWGESLGVMRRAEMSRKGYWHLNSMPLNVSSIRTLFWMPFRFQRRLWGDHI